MYYLRCIKVEKKIIFINPRTYTHAYTPTVVQDRGGGGGDCCNPSPEFLRCYNI